ncbi:tartrate-resistant acid phosphatase type 5 family protein [Mucilaginibacter sp. RS28]|uniref:acid phosphatase n=1 Tax=Mucilaginibacter straminoryzae TaxID=2932774 RepID=A0A9X1X0D1_9SPHI|nr:tartrate-resistant acid phosphatase type 5 family protein [Mucilaginibacter straminoryzae]MCJ8208839.1 tartrate-resistant acid phosphatase type 5 family protein [Mucilaginibacter straminoryzae]
MKRRDFVKSTAVTALSASLIAPLTSLAEDKVTNLSSDDVSPRAALADDFSLHFLAIGDWGRSGEYKQIETGRQMGEWAKTHPNNFVISVGDNFYPNGVISEQDPQFRSTFEDIYTAHSLHCDWHVILGNHDWHGDPDAQVRYSKVSRRWNMPARYYKKEFKLNQGKALFVMIDTDPMLFDAKNEYSEKQIAWINETLSNAGSDIKWKIVVGHHPTYTVGPRISNYDTLTIRKRLTETFEKHKVDIYLSGHDHSLQHLKPEGHTHMFISGAGSELTQVSSGIPYSKFQASENGFMYFSMNDNRINVKAISYNGAVLYETELSR